MKKGSRTYERGQLQPQRYIPQTQEAEKKSRRMSLAHKVTLLVSLIFILLFAAAVKFCLLPALTGSGMESYNAPPSSLISTEETKAASPAVTMDTLYSPCAILKELDSGDILASRNASERIYPASLTKIMTALLAIENTPDLDQPIGLPEELFLNYISDTPP